MHKIVSIKIMMDTIFHLSEAHLKMRSPDAYPQDAFTGCLHCCRTTGGPQNNNTPQKELGPQGGLGQGVFTGWIRTAVLSHLLNCCNLEFFCKSSLTHKRLLKTIL